MEEIDKPTPASWLSFRPQRRLDARLEFLLEEVDAGIFEPSKGTYDQDPPLIKRTVDLLQDLGERVADARLATNWIAHEMRRPLGSAIDYIDLAKRAKTPEEVERNLLQARAVLDGMDDGMRTLLQFAREDGPPPRVVSLSMICQVAADGLRSGADAKGLRLRLAIEQDLNTLGDERGLLSVVQNLVENAIKYTSHGEVAIELRRIDRTRFAIVVTDTGPGLSSNERSKVTKPFFRGSDTMGAEGSGLGLSLVRRLTRRYGFAFTIKNRDQGVEARVIGPIATQRLR
jgi:signal transduction histidine kinase